MNCQRKSCSSSATQVTPATVKASGEQIGLQLCDEHTARLKSRQCMFRMWDAIEIDAMAFVAKVEGDSEGYEKVELNVNSRLFDDRELRVASSILQKYLEDIGANMIVITASSEGPDSSGEGDDKSNLDENVQQDVLDVSFCRLSDATPCCQVEARFVKRVPKEDDFVGYVDPCTWVCSNCGQPYVLLWKIAQLEALPQTDENTKRIGKLRLQCESWYVLDTEEIDGVESTVGGDVWTGNTEHVHE